MLSACSPAYLQQRTDEPQNASDIVKDADLTPRFGTPIRQSSGSEMPTGGFLSFGVATPAPAVDDNPTAKTSSDGLMEMSEGYALNFEAAPVSQIAKVVLGDILGLHYTVDQRVRSKINLSSSKPIQKGEIFFVFESALRANNLVIIREAGGYRIAPIDDNGVFGPSDMAQGSGDVAAGYGLTVIPLRYLSGTALTRLLEGFSNRPGTLRADPSGRLMLVVGTGEERRAAVETARRFDVDWMRGQSVGLVTVRNGSSSSIVNELEKILDSGEAGLDQGLVKLQDITAQNAILVVTSRPSLLRTAANWINRLDAPNLGAARVHVYKVRYGDAKQLAHLLTTMFGTEASSGRDEDIAPGEGAKHISPSDRLTGGTSSSSSYTPQTGGRPPQNQNGSQGRASNAGPESPFGGLQTAALNQAFAAAGDQGAGGSVLPNVRITADTQDNAILVYASSENYRTIEEALEQIDRPRAQVAIDVTIAEVTLNDQLNYGVQVYISSHLGSITNTDTGLPPTSSSAASGFNVFVGNYTSPHAIINALHQLADVRILSNPSLVVVDNQQATLEVGDQVPIATGGANVLSANNAVVNTYDYKNTGIILDVVPHVSPDNTVQLEVDQEISNVVTDATTSNSGASSSASPNPTISERKVKSDISVADGQLVMLAGLITETQNKSRSGIPGLDQLPLVGGAFGSTGTQRQRTELIILIRPQVIRNSVDMSRVAEQLRAKLRGGRIDALSLEKSFQVGAKKEP